MDKQLIVDLRHRVSCPALLERGGWLLDRKESSRRALKYRRSDGEIIIVIHDGAGWFDPLSDAKGDVFRLAEHLGAGGFAQAIAEVASASGFIPQGLVWEPHVRPRALVSLEDRWRRRPSLQEGSSTWRYLEGARQIPRTVLRRAIATGAIREGPRGSVWAAHRNASGTLIGWEERGPAWRGFATGGTKQLFSYGAVAPRRICVTEAAIDALSLAALEGEPPDTLYVSTAGGWSPDTDEALATLVRSSDALLVAATDSNPQGDHYAERLRASSAGGGYCRLRPDEEDWNDQLRRLCERTAAGREGELNPVAERDAPRR